MKSGAGIPSLFLCLLLAIVTAAGDAEALPRAGAAGWQTASDIVPVQFWKRERRERRAEPERRPGIFRFLFREQRQRAAPRPMFIPDDALPRQEAERPRKQRRKRRAEPAAPAVVAVEKAEDAKRVLVIGDFMAGALAKGLIDAYAESANVVVVDKSSGSSGLVRGDFHDWREELPSLVEEHKPEAILVLIGANDRQSIDTDAGTQEIGSDGWRAAYAARVGALADALKLTGKPVLWAGLAPVKPSAMSRDYSTLNGIVREQLESRGLKFAETWNGFADAEGKYISAGPDMNGQSVQLRNSDGLNFTRAGQRKLAFFVESDLNLILGNASPQLAALGSAAPVGLAAPEPGTSIGPMVPLDALVSAGGDILSTAAAPISPGVAPAAEQGEGGGAATAIAKRLSGDARLKPPAGRADDFAWAPAVDPVGAGSTAPDATPGSVLPTPAPPVPATATPLSAGSAELSVVSPLPSSGAIPTAP